MLTLLTFGSSASLQTVSDRGVTYTARHNQSSCSDPWRCVLCAQGDVHKKKEVVQDVTLHDLDAANARPQVRLLSQQVGCFDSCLCSPAHHGCSITGITRQVHVHDPKVLWISVQWRLRRAGRT